MGSNQKNGRESDPKNRAYGFTLQNTQTDDHHRNQYFALSQKASNEVMKIPGVAHAYVFVTDLNAYAAIMLNHVATGIQSDGDRDSDVTNVGNSEGVYDIRDGGSYLSPRKLANDSNSYFTYEKPADLGHSLKQKIAVAIRNVQPEVGEVFISANRDLVNQFNVYAQKTWLGQSLDSDIHAFNNLVRHHFKINEPQ